MLRQHTCHTLLPGCRLAFLSLSISCHATLILVSYSVTEPGSSSSALGCFVQVRYTSCECCTAVPYSDCVICPGVFRLVSRLFTRYHTPQLGLCRAYNKWGSSFPKWRLLERNRCWTYCAGAFTIILYQTFNGPTVDVRWSAALFPTIFEKARATLFITMHVSTEYRSSQEGK